jgi:hypothetical protein
MIIPSKNSEFETNIPNDGYVVIEKENKLLVVVGVEIRKSSMSFICQPANLPFSKTFHNVNYLDIPYLNTFYFTTLLELYNFRDNY